VLRILGNRNVELKLHHYEALVEAWVGSGDVKTALAVLCIMKRSRLEPEDGSTRPLLAHLCKDPTRLQKTVDSLNELYQSGRKVPTAAINCVIEASVALGNMSEALRYYNEVEKVCSYGRNTSTYNILFEGCRINGDRNLALMLASEMQALKLEPDMLTYDRLISVCALSRKHYKDGFKYLEEMEGRGWSPTQRTYEELIRACVDARDDLTWALLLVLREKDYDVDELEKWCKTQWAKQKTPAQVVQGDGEKTMSTM
jgi:pentatricopeptide repeat protein